MIPFCREYLTRRDAPARPLEGAVWGETDRLTDVVLSAPAFLKPVPCCSTTRESLRNGFTVSASAALQQHERLRQLLTNKGVRCHSMRPAANMPDLCFTRDVAVATPWGVVVLNPATAHRAPEVTHALQFIESRSGVPAERIRAGKIEGGDVCIVRAGLLVIGVSGERTDCAGADAFAQPFRANGWEVLICSFDPHFLHLDTIFCMLDPSRALACTDALDDHFIQTINGYGIEVLTVTYKEARRLGCNILSLDGHSVVASSATPRVSAMMRQSGFEVHEIEISQFSACGGGVHCLTMPLARRPNAGSSEDDVCGVTPAEMLPGNTLQLAG